MNFWKSTAEMAVWFVLACSPVALSAQVFGSGQPGEDTFSVGVLTGQLDPQTTYRDGGRFDSSTLIGVAGTWWGSRYLGVNGGLAFAESDAVAPDGGISFLTGQDPRQTLVHVDGVIRYPLGDAGAVTGFPYVAAGMGGKYYRFSRVDTHPEWDLAWSYAVGGELRVGQQGRVGLRAEFRDVRSNFRHFGEDRTHSDRLLMAGLMINL